VRPAPAGAAREACDGVTRERRDARRVEEARWPRWRSQARGVTVLHPARIVHRDERHVLWMAFFLDSEGNRFALIAEAPPV
jgi:predicted enzyme related to lactoylglutathione lyase